VKRGVFITGLLLLAIGVAVYLWKRNSINLSTVGVEKNQPETIATKVAVTTSSGGETTQREKPLLGETILRNYGRTNLPPENDLTLMYRLMENSLLLLKSAGNQPLSANEDWAALLRGQNAARERFLPENHPALDAQGRLVDRWGAPLFFHALGGGRYELRSAGPDKKLWTEDDIHRNADGSFRRGAELNAGSLLEAAGR
jgi:hypothetical protein